MTSNNRNIREQTLFDLYENPPYNDTDLALREALDQVISKVVKTKGEWTRQNNLAIAKEISTKVGVPYKDLTEKMNIDITKQTEVSSLFKLDEKILAKVLDPNRTIQGYTAKNLFKQLSDTHVKQLQVTFAAAASRGATTDEIVRLLTEKNSILTKSQLKSAVITMGLEARADVRHDNYRVMELDGLIDGYTYNATMDGRTTEYCRNHDGRTYWKPIKEIRNLINVHFRCRSVFIPASKDSYLRATVFGPVQDETYSKWFAKQPADFQKTTLGTKKYAEYEKGNYKVGGLADLGSSALSLSVIQDLLYHPVAATAGTMTAQSTALSQHFIEESAYPVRSFVDDVDVKGVGEAGFQYGVTGEGLSLVSKVDLLTKSVIVHDFVLPTAIRGEGYSKEILSNIITAYKDYNIGNISLVAGKKDGTSFWLYMGFQPTDREAFKTMILSIDEGLSTYLKEWDRGYYGSLSEMVKEHPELRKSLEGKVIDMDINLRNIEQFNLVNKKITK